MKKTWKIDGMNEMKESIWMFLNWINFIPAAQLFSFIPFLFSLRMRREIENEMKRESIGGRSGNEAWLGWIVFWWVIGGGSRRQPAKREDEQAKRNVFLLFHLHQLWMKRIIDWEMEWRDEIEEQTKPTHSSLFNSSTTLSFVAVAGKANKRVEFAVGLFESGGVSLLFFFGG